MVVRTSSGQDAIVWNEWEFFNPLMNQGVEYKTIAEKATAHKLYHTTLYNHFLILTRHATITAELDNITYSADCLPLDLAENMKKILVAAGITE